MSGAIAHIRPMGIAVGPIVITGAAIPIVGAAIPIAERPTSVAAFWQT